MHCLLSSSAFGGSSPLHFKTMCIAMVYGDSLCCRCSFCTCVCLVTYGKSFVRHLGMHRWACRLLGKETMCCMRNILHHRLAGSTGPVYPNRYGYHRHPPGRAWPCICDSTCKANCHVLLSRQRDLCCNCHDHSDIHTWSDRSPLVRGQRP